MVDSAVERLLSQRSRSKPRQYDPEKNGDFKQPTKEDKPKKTVDEPPPTDFGPWPPAAWEEGFLCDALDRYGGWFAAKVIETEDGDVAGEVGRVKVHFQGWGAKFEEWIKVPSERLAPLTMYSSKVAKAAAGATLSPHTWR